MKISVNRQINAPVGAIWFYLADFGNIHKFHPQLRESQYTQGSIKCEVGATRHCDFKNGHYLKERIIDLKSNAYYTVELESTSLPFKSGTITTGVRPQSDKKCEAFIEFDVLPKYKLLAPVMFMILKYSVGFGILKGLEKLYNTQNEYGFDQLDHYQKAV